MKNINESKIIETQHLAETLTLNLLENFCKYREDKEIDIDDIEHFSKSYIDVEDGSIHIMVFIKYIDFRYKSKPPSYLLTDIEYDLKNDNETDILQKIKQYTNTAWEYYFKGNNKGYKQYFDFVNRGFEPRRNMLSLPKKIYGIN